MNVRQMNSASPVVSLEYILNCFKPLDCRGITRYFLTGSELQLHQENKKAIDRYGRWLLIYKCVNLAVVAVLVRLFHLVGFATLFGLLAVLIHIISIRL